MTTANEFQSLRCENFVTALVRQQQRSIRKMRENGLFLQLHLRPFDPPVGFEFLYRLDLCLTKWIVL